MVQADQVRGELFVLDRSYNMAVSVRYDTQLTDITFVSPSGDMIAAGTLPHDSGEGWVQYYIQNAAAGRWEIIYDKSNNTLFDIYYSSYTNPLTITEFSVGEKDRNYIPVSFTVEGDDVYYNYKIDAVITDESGDVIGERELEIGYAPANEFTETQVYIRDLSDYDAYKLRLNVWRNDGVVEVFDSKISDNTFEITGNVDPLNGTVLVEVDLTDEMVFADFSDIRGYGEYLVAFFDDSTSKTEPFYHLDCGEDTKSVSALYPPEAKEIRLVITRSYNGQNTNQLTKIIKLQTGVSISSPEQTVFNSQSMKVEYNASNAVSADIIVGEKKDTVNLQGSGFFSVGLSEGYNEIEIQYRLKDDENVLYSLKLEASLDNTPPVLRLPEHKNIVTTSDKEYIIVGVTEAGALLNIGGVDVSVNPDGTFMHAVTLSDKEDTNTISVVASDMAGNVAKQDVIIKKASGNILAGATREEGSSLLRFAPVVLAVVVSGLFVVAGVLIPRGFEKASNKTVYIFKASRNVLIGMSGISALLLGGSLYKYLTLNKTVNSDAFFKLALESVEKASNMLTERAAWLDRLIVVGIITGCLAVLAVICGVVLMLMKKSSNTPEQKNGEKTETLPESDIVSDESSSADSQ